MDRKTETKLVTESTLATTYHMLTCILFVKIENQIMCMQVAFSYLNESKT